MLLLSFFIVGAVVVVPFQAVVVVTTVLDVMYSHVSLNDGIFILFCVKMSHKKYSNTSTNNISHEFPNRNKSVISQRISSQNFLSELSKQVF